MSLRIRRAGLSDLDAIVAIEHESFSAAWSREALRAELADDPRRLSLIAQDGEIVVGYALVWIIADELHLVSLAVVPAWRRRGVANALMETILDSGPGQRASIVTLEVRASNEAALALYRRWGFLEIAIRPHYYPDDREDAVVMLKVLRRPDSEGPGLGGASVPPLNP